jgi:hypothetical protein
MVTIYFPGRKLRNEIPIMHIFATALVCLEQYDLMEHGPIPKSAKENILVSFFYKEWKVWVSIPYPEAKRRMPQLPDLPCGQDAEHNQRWWWL